MSAEGKLQIRSHMSKWYAFAIAKRIASVLKKHGATKVMLFGSLCTRKYDPDYSDIDIYYEGIPLNKTIHAEVDATWTTGEEDETGRRRVDLVSGYIRNTKVISAALAHGMPL